MNLRKLVFTTLLVLGLTPAHAAYYDLSFLFEGNTFTASVEGTLTSPNVLNIASLSDLQFNNTALSLNSTIGGRLSLNGLDNGLFIDASYASGDYWGTMLFAVVSYQGCNNIFCMVDSKRVNDTGNTWTLTEAVGTTAVPETSALLIFGFGLLGLFGAVRRKS